MNCYTNKHKLEPSFYFFVVIVKNYSPKTKYSFFFRDRRQASNSLKCFYFFGNFFWGTLDPTLSEKKT